MKNPQNRKALRAYLMHKANYLAAAAASLAA